jgi:hypothetical protein
MPTETFNLGPLTIDDKTVSAVVTVETSGEPPPPDPVVVGGGPDNFPVLANNGTDSIDFTAGAAWDSTATVRMTCPALTKSLAPWVAGAGGGRYSGAALVDGTYCWYAVCKAEGADADYYAHPSDTDANVLAHLQAETGGADYLHIRYIGSVIRKGGAILPFDQTGADFLLKTAQHDHNAADIGTTATLITTTVPVGRKVIGKYRFSANQAAAWAILFSSPDETDQAPGTMGPATAGTSTAAVRVNSEFERRTDTSGRIRARSTTNATDLDLRTHGWTDPALSGRYL